MLKTKPPAASVTFLGEAADVLRREGPLPFPALADRVLSRAELADRGRTPADTLYALIWKASHGQRKARPGFRMTRRDGHVVVEIEE